MSARAKPSTSGRWFHSSRSFSRLYSVSSASSGNGSVSRFSCLTSEPRADFISCGLSMVSTSPMSYIPYLPARPAICLISAVFRSLACVPSNFLVSQNMIRLIGSDMPIPIASVATTTLVSPAVNLRTSSRLDTGGNAPYMTLALMPCPSSSAATDRTDLLENTIRASPGLANARLRNIPAYLRGARRLCSTTS